MLTADTITEEQIRELLRDLLGCSSSDPTEIRHAEVASSKWYRAMAPNEWINARARCAEILNTRPTANTITDEQIRAYHDAGKPTDEVHEVCRVALYAAPGSTKRKHARAQVAEWINARKERP